MIFLLAFVLSALGIGALIFRLFKTDATFVPVLSITVCISLLYIGGLFGLLETVSWLIRILGIVSFVYYIFRDRKSFSFLASPGFCFFVVVSVCIAIAVYGKTPYKYDNYTHWALIMKSLYYADALPNTESLVSYINYPPASALWGYYVMKCLRFGEDVMVAAQGMLAASAVSALFATIKFNSIGKIVVAVMSAVTTLFVVEVNLTNLYVDALLAYLSVAAVCVLYHSVSINSFSPQCSAPIFTTLILLKPSGMLLAFFALLYGVYFVIKKSEKRQISVRIFKLLFWAVVVPLIFYISFLLRVDIVYGDNPSVQFDISVSGMTSGLKSKSPEFLSAFVPAFMSSILNLSEPAVLICLVSLAVLFVVLVFLKIFKHKADYLPYLFSVLFLLLYVVGLFVMYISWMSESESLSLASFSRYVGTGVAFFVGCVCFFVIKEDIKALRWRNVMYGIMCIPLCFCIRTGAKFPDYRPYVEISTKAREAVITAAHEVEELVVDFDMIIWCVDDRPEQGYYNYVSKYAFLRRDVKAMTSSRIQQDVWSADKDDCLILLVHPSNEVLNYLCEKFGEGTYQTGLYQKHLNTLIPIKMLDFSK